MNETKKLFRWFWAWNDEKEEQWLTEMAQLGWHLTEPGVLGLYTFEHGAPRNIVYRLDFKTASKDLEEYQQLFADAGWEHVGSMGGWQYFRKEATPGETPEIYTDNDSKVQKYQRVLLFLIILMPAYMMTLNTISQSPSGYVELLSFVLACFMLLYTYALVRIFLRIRQLKK